MSKPVTVATAIAASNKAINLTMPADCRSIENAATSKFGEGISLVQYQRRSYNHVAGSTANKMASAAVSSIGYKMDDCGELTPKSKANSKPAAPNGDKVLAYVGKCKKLTQDEYDAIVAVLKTLVK